MALIAAVIPSAYKAIILYHDEMIGSTNAGWAMAVAFGALDYRSTILKMFGALLSCGVSDLLLGFASAAAGFPSIPAVIADVVYVLVVVGAFVLAPARVRFRLIGVIAAGRATLTPVIHVTFGATTPRYHYVGTIPLSILLGCALAQLTRSSRHAMTIHNGLLLATMAVGAVFFVLAKPFIDPHLPARNETTDVVARIRATIAAAPAGAEVHIANQRFQAVGILLRDFQSGFPGWAGVYALFFPANEVDGKPVRFVIDDPIVVRNLAIGKRSRDLFVVGTTSTPAPAAAKPAAAS
jgi:hypothetical protein